MSTEKKLYELLTYFDVEAYLNASKYMENVF